MDFVFILVICNADSPTAWTRITGSLPAATHWQRTEWRRGAAPKAFRPRLLGTHGYDAGDLESAQQAIGNPSGRMSVMTLGPAVLPAPAAALRGLYARPELDDDPIGEYIRDEIGRGDYRTALEYSHEHKFLTLFLMNRRLIDACKRVRNLCTGLCYGRGEAKVSDTPWHWFRTREQMLGLFGICDLVEADPKK